MTVHELKSWPEFFQPVYDGTKNFELRQNDRNFEVGDTLTLREWKPESIGGTQTGYYTGRACTRRITYILKGLGVGPMQGVVKPYWGLDRGFAILGLKPHGSANEAREILIEISDYPAALIALPMPLRDRLEAEAAIAKENKEP